MVCDDGMANDTGLTLDNRSRRMRARMWFSHYATRHTSGRCHSHVVGGGGGCVFLCPSQFIHETSQPIRENSCRVPVDTNIIKNNMILKSSKVRKKVLFPGINVLRK